MTHGGDAEELSGSARNTQALAAAARTGDAWARNALWEKVGETVAAALSRQRSLPRLWDREDLRQEAFIVFAAVCDAWPGGDFGAYFEDAYGAELARHVRRAWRKQLRESSTSVAPESATDAGAGSEYRLAELLEALSRLPASTKLALRLHLLGGLPLHQVGRQLGLGRRALGGLLPSARKAVLERPEAEEARLERQVRELYAFADSSGRIRGTARQVRTRLGLAPREHAELLSVLEERGVLKGRSRGHAGRLPQEGPEAAVRLLRRTFHRLSA